MRWRLKLEEYEYEILYKAGKTNVNADALSRIEVKTTQTGTSESKNHQEENQSQAEEESEKQEVNQANKEPAKENIKLKVYKDKNGNFRHWIHSHMERKQLLREYHDTPLGGHRGYKRTLDALKLNYYWPNMKRDIIEYVSTCISCNQRKTSQTDHKPVPLQISNTPSRPFQHIAIDVVGPLPMTQNGNKYLLTFQDIFSKYPEAVPMSDQTVVAKTFVNKIICRHGCPESLTTDLGTNFTSQLFSEICSLLQIRKITYYCISPPS